MFKVKHLTYEQTHKLNAKEHADTFKAVGIVSLSLMFATIAITILAIFSYSFNKLFQNFGSMIGFLAIIIFAVIAFSTVNLLGHLNILK